MAHRTSNRVFVTIFIGSALILGFLIRVLSGYPAVRTNLVYSPGESRKPPGTKTPGDTAVAFYMFLDNGQYQQAWELVLEPDYIGRGRVAQFTERVEADPDSFHGWTDRERFIERMRWELGPGGTGITLKNIRVKSIQEIDLNRYVQENPLFEYLEKSSTIDYQVDAEAAYLVSVTGNLLGACTIYRWDTRVVVLRIDKSYRLLVPGTKGAKSFYYRDWFSTMDKIGNLRGIE